MHRKNINQVSEQAVIYRKPKTGKLTDNEKKAILDHIDRLAGSSKRRTTDEERHEIGERAFAELEKRIKIRRQAF